MALKGNTIIELYDSSTDELVNRVEKDNLVTQGVPKFLSNVLRSSFYDKGTIYDRYAVLTNSVDTKYNLFTILFGGLYVFDKPVDEKKIYFDRDLLLSNIGHAGLIATKHADDISCGNFNDEESVIDTQNRTVKFVWDFDTGACNGDIACVSLGNAMTAQYGIACKELYNVPTTWDYTWRYKISPTAESTAVFFPLYNWGRLMTQNPVIWVYDETLKSIRLFNRLNGMAVTMWTFPCNSKEDACSMRILGMNHLNLADAAQTTIDFATVAPAAYTTHGAIWQNKDFIYSFCTSDSANKTVTYRLCRGDLTYEDVVFNLADFYESLREYGYQYLAYFWSSNDIGQFKNLYIKERKIMLLATKAGAGRFYVVNPDGTFTYEDLDPAPTKETGSQYYSVNRYDNAYLLQYNNSNAYVLDENFKITNSVRINTSLATHCDINVPCLDLGYVDEGFAPSSELNFFDSGMVSCVRTDYLATINNQETVLTKSNTQTMKITYELREVD